MDKPKSDQTVSASETVSIATSPHLPVNAPGGFLFGYPKGIFLVGGTEFWDRFSFYGMMGLMVLFLSDAVATGGFGWSEASALRLYGVYTALIYITPIAGGWIASKWLGEQRSVAIGGILIVIGHFLLGGPAYFPGLIDTLSGTAAGEAVHKADIPLGFLLITEEMKAALIASGERYGVDGSWVFLSYYVISLSFSLGLFFIMIGTGLLKPAISTIVGGFYKREDSRKDSAYTIFLISIFLGGFLSNFIAGTLGETLGWHYGLAAAGFGMLVGIIVYLWKQRAWLGNIGLEPTSRSKQKHIKAPLKVAEKNRLVVIAIAGVGAIIYAAIFYQKGGLLHLIAKQSTDRTILGFDVPATWLLSVSTGTFLLIAPFSTKLWECADKKGFGFDLPRKLAIGMTFLVLGLAIQFGGVFERSMSEDGVSSIWWFIPTYILFGLGDVFFWPASYSAVSRLSPERLSSVTFGIYYIVFGIGTWLSAEIGAIALSLEQGVVFLGLIGFGSALIIFLVIARTMINRAIDGESVFFKS